MAVAELWRAADAQERARAPWVDRGSALFDLAVRFRFALLGLAAVVCAVLTRHDYPPDSVQFGRLGVDLLRGRLGQVYADNWNQSGPLQLVVNALFLPKGESAVGLLAMHLVGNVAVLVVLVAGCRRCRRGLGLPASPRAELLIGTAALLWLVPGAFWQGHISGLLIPAMWFSAAESARRGHPYLAAVLLGLAAGVEPWGVLAVGVLLLERRWWVAIRAGVLAVLVAAALYVPFVLTGHFELFGHLWPINPTTPAHLLWPDSTWYSWQMRVLQGLVSSVGCAGVALVLRTRPGAAVWLAPATAVLFRLVLDPTVFDYYWTPLCLLALVGASALSTRSTVPAVVATLTLAYLPYVKPATTITTNLALTVLALLMTVWCARRTSGQQSIVQPRSPID